MKKEKVIIGLLSFILFLSITFLSKSIYDKQYVKFKKIIFNGNRYIEVDKEMTYTERCKLTMVLSYYKIPVHFTYFQELEVQREYMIDKELIYNIVNKANDKEWYNSHIVNPPAITHDK